MDTYGNGSFPNNIFFSFIDSFQLIHVGKKHTAQHSTFWLHYGKFYFYKSEEKKERKKETADSSVLDSLESERM